MDKKNYDVPFRAPVSLAKDGFMVLLGIDRDGDVELGQKVATQVRGNLAKAKEDVTGLVARYSAHETGEAYGDLGGISEDEINQLKKRYNLP